MHYSLLVFMRTTSFVAALAALTLLGAGCSATTTPPQAAAPAPAPAAAPAPVVAMFKVGDMIEARWKGGSVWYKGTISAVAADGTYSIAYSDGDKESGVKEANVKLQAAPAPAPAAAVVKFKVGDKVDSHWKGGTVWWKATITKVNANGTYDVLFDDGDKESGIAAASVRVRQ